MRMPRIGLAFAGITAGLLTLFGVNAQASSPTPTGDCKRVAPATRTLCASVQTQRAYSWQTKGGNIGYAPNGRILVRDITHQGLTKAEMHDALRGQAAQYKRRGWYTYATVDMTAVAERCGTDGQWIVGFKDDDGRPGGHKTITARIDCP